jgi:site-specific DNA-methyltransferase (adenine-specific)
MRRLIAEGFKVDSIVCDPPYHLESIVKRFGGQNAAAAQSKETGVFARASSGFMGQGWDGADADGRRIAFERETWDLARQLLRPGGYLLSFGATRTYHRMAVAIEDAGFDIRDMIAWTYGSGMPKSQPVDKFIDKALGQEGTYGDAKSAAHADWQRRGSMRGDEGEGGWQRPWMDDAEAVNRAARRYLPASDEAKARQGHGTALKPALEPICMARAPMDQTSIARNVIAHGVGSLNIEGCRVPFASAEDEAESKTKNSHARFGSGPTNNKIYGAFSRDRDDYDAPGRFPANLVHDGSEEVLACFPMTAPAKAGKPRAGQSGQGWGMTHTGAEYDDLGGSAARFFFSAKADAMDRVSRCSQCGARALGRDPGCGHGSKHVIRHPTVKPLDLMRWLVRLVTPPGGTVLDIFAGTGSTGIAAAREGFEAILIEQSADYVGDIHFRINAMDGGDTPLFAGA